MQTTGEQRVLRGGSWINNGQNLRAAIRNANAADKRNNSVGFRLSQLVEQGLCGPGIEDQRCVLLAWPLSGRGSENKRPKQ